MSEKSTKKDDLPSPPSDGMDADTTLKLILDDLMQSKDQQEFTDEDQAGFVDVMMTFRHLFYIIGCKLLTEIHWDMIRLCEKDENSEILYLSKSKIQGSLKHKYHMFKNDDNVEMAFKKLGIKDEKVPKLKLLDFVLQACLSRYWEIARLYFWIFITQVPVTFYMLYSNVMVYRVYLSSLEHDVNRGKPGFWDSIQFLRNYTVVSLGIIISAVFLQMKQFSLITEINGNVTDDELVRKNILKHQRWEFVNIISFYQSIVYGQQLKLLFQTQPSIKNAQEVAQGTYADFDQIYCLIPQMIYVGHIHALFRKLQNDFQKSSPKIGYFDFWFDTHNLTCRKFFIGTISQILYNTGYFYILSQFAVKVAPTIYPNIAMDALQCYPTIDLSPCNKFYFLSCNFCPLFQYWDDSTKQCKAQECNDTNPKFPFHYFSLNTKGKCKSINDFGDDDERVDFVEKLKDQSFVYQYCGHNNIEEQSCRTFALNFIDGDDVTAGKWNDLDNQSSILDNHFVSQGIRSQKTDFFTQQLFLSGRQLEMKYAVDKHPEIMTKTQQSTVWIHQIHAPETKVMISQILEEIPQDITRGDFQSLRNLVKTIQGAPRVALKLHYGERWQRDRPYDSTTAYFSIKGLQESLSKNLYYDIELLTTMDVQKEDFLSNFEYSENYDSEKFQKSVDKLKEFNETSSDGTVCCWQDTRPHINGFARIVVYRNGVFKGKETKEVISMWEGEVQNGFLSGFGKEIYIQKKRMFVGFFDSSMNGANNFVRGPGIYYENGAVKDFGVYGKGQKYWNKPEFTTIQKNKEVKGGGTAQYQYKYENSNQMFNSFYFGVKNGTYKFD